MISEMERAFCKSTTDGAEPWMSTGRFYKLMGAAQAIPGPIGITFGCLLRYKARGFSGALVSILAVLIPPTIIIAAFLVYQPLSTNEYIQYFFEGFFAFIPAIVGIILVKMLKSRRWNWWSLLLLALGTGAFIIWPRLTLPIFMIISGFAWLGGRISSPPKPNGESGEA